MNLLDYKKNISSQYGEDGIIEKIIQILNPLENKFFVEFGAWDGKYLSNTYNLFKNHEFRGLYIEGDLKRANKLKKDFLIEDRIICEQAFVQSSGQNSLTNILERNNVPNDFFLLSIDIDGNDFEVWKSLENYSPRVVIIEYNPSFPPNKEFIDAGGDCYIGSSALSLSKLGKSKGYELITATESNLIFVRDEFYSKFEIHDNSVVNLQFKGHLNEVYLNFSGELVFEKDIFPNKFNISYKRFKKKAKGIFKKSYYFLGQKYD